MVMCIEIMKGPFQGEQIRIKSAADLCKFVAGDFQERCWQTTNAYLFHLSVGPSKILNSGLESYLVGEEG